MSYMVSDSVVMTADGTTLITDYTATMNGEIVAVGFYNSASEIPTTFTLAVTVADSGYTILESVALSSSLSWNWYYPRANIHNTTGSALDYGTTGNASVTPIQAERFPVAGERIKAVIAGTSAITANLAGTFKVIVEGSRVGGS